MQHLRPGLFGVEPQMEVCTLSYCWVSLSMLPHSPEHHLPTCEWSSAIFLTGV